VAVHDGWAPYWRFEDVRHALCGAHLLRELEAITDEPGQGWAAGMAELLIDVKLTCDRARAAGCGRVDDDARARLQGRYQRLLADGKPPTHPRGLLAAAAHGARQPSTCWPGSTAIVTRCCGHWTTAACRSTTTRPNATCAW
jgi:hypothetical protein